MVPVTYFTITTNSQAHTIVSPFITLEVAANSTNTANSPNLTLKLTSNQRNFNVEVGDRILIWAASATQLNISLSTGTIFTSLYNVTAIDITGSPVGSPSITCVKPTNITTAGTYAAALVGPVILVKAAQANILASLMSGGYTLNYKDFAGEDFVIPGNSINSNHLLTSAEFVNRFTGGELRDILDSTDVRCIKLRETMRAGPTISLADSTIQALVTSLLSINSPNTPGSKILDPDWTHVTLAINKAEHILRM